MYGRVVGWWGSNRRIIEMHNEERHDRQSSPDTIKVVKSKRVR
jgi:hypothetical protein